MTVTVLKNPHRLALIRRAAMSANLDAATATIRDGIGQTDDTVAQAYFSETERREYSDHSYPGRVFVIAGYLKAEEAHAPA